MSLGWRWRVSSAVFAAFVLAGSTAWGGPDSGVDSVLYRPSFDAEGMWAIDNDRTIPALDFVWKTESAFGLAPLELPVPGIGEAAGDEASDRVLSYVFALHNVIVFGLTSRLALGIEAALYRTDPAEGYGERSRYSPAEDPSSTGLIALRPLSNIDPSGGFEQTGLSGPLDARVAAKYRLLGDPTSRFGIAVLGIMRLPFGNEEMFVGDSGIVLEPKLAAGFHGRSWSIVGTLGALLRQRAVLESYDPRNGQMPEDAAVVLDVGSEMAAGLGISTRVLPLLAIVGEVNVFAPLPKKASLGGCKLNDGRNCDGLNRSDYFADQGRGDLTAYSLLGVHYQASENITIRLAGGAGFLGARSDTFRTVLGFTWQPDSSAGQRLRHDADRDGLADAADGCPNDPEDDDGFQDDDGCPELDNDGDGILDANDSCAVDPEDKDGYKDEEGCPEPDNDADGILDVIDSCPMDPEDKDQFFDEDGCPDKDNDGDGLADASDRCPNDAETPNGYQDEDGCPDASETGGPTLAQDRIDLSGARIEFAGARSGDLTAGSKTLLDQVAQVIKAGKVQVRIEVHVPLGTRSTNKAQVAKAQRGDRLLSDRRATVILRYLVSAGVPLADLQAVGLGSSRPRGDLQPSEAAQARVDFILIRQARP